MKIESVEVIPMSKESKWEDIKTPFEVSFITTSFDEWYARTLKHQEETGTSEYGKKWMMLAYHLLKCNKVLC